MPKRVQLRRKRGWRKPDDVITVARPTKWGNPHRTSAQPGVTMEQKRRAATDLFRADLEACLADPVGRTLYAYRHEIRAIAETLHELRGHDLACWCPLDHPCHADVLLELANREDAAGG